MLGRNRSTCRRPLSQAAPHLGQAAGATGKHRKGGLSSHHWAPFLVDAAIPTHLEGGPGAALEGLQSAPPGLAKQKQE